MVWLQAAVCFVVWVAYGLQLRRQSDRLRSKMASLSRLVRVLFGSVFLVLALVVLAGGLWAIDATSWHSGGSLTAPGWIAAVVLGLVFVRLQVTGAAAMVSLVIEEVTATKDRPSFPLENP